MMDILINTYDTMAKILLVEDEVNIASFIERGLREFGHEVYVAYDGAAGWEFPIADSGYYNAEDERPATLQTVPATVRLPCSRDHADRLGNHRGYR